MPDLPISGLPAAGPLSAADPLVIVQAGVTVQTTQGDLSRFIFGGAYVSGKYFTPYRAGIAISGSGVQANFIQTGPFVVTDSVTIDAVAYRIATASSGAGNFKFAIYLTDANGEETTGLPIAETASIASNTAAGNYVTALAATVTLEPGQVYWFALWADATAAGGTALVLTASSGTELNYLRASPSPTSLFFTSAAASGCIQYSSVYGAWPDLTGVVPSSTNAGATRLPYFSFRVA